MQQAKEAKEEEYNAQQVVVRKEKWATLVDTETPKRREERQAGARVRMANHRARKTPEEKEADLAAIR